MTRRRYQIDAALSLNSKGAPNFPLSFFNADMSKNGVSGGLTFPLPEWTPFGAIFVPITNATLDATLTRDPADDRNPERLTQGTVSGYITSYSYFQALDALALKKCPCFGDLSPFSFNSMTQTASCDKGFVHKCDDTSTSLGAACNKLATSCVSILREFDAHTDMIRQAPDLPCAAGDTCNAMSVGVKFTAERAFLDPSLSPK